MTEAVMELLILRSLLRFSLAEDLISSNQNQQRQLGSIEWPNPKSNHAKINPKILVHSNLSSFSEIKLRQGVQEAWLAFSVSLRLWMTIDQGLCLNTNLEKLAEILRQEFRTIMYQFFLVHLISTEMVYSALMNSFLQSVENSIKEGSRLFKRHSKLLIKMAQASWISMILKIVTMHLNTLMY